MTQERIEILHQIPDKDGTFSSEAYQIILELEYYESEIFAVSYDIFYVVIDDERKIILYLSDWTEEPTDKLYSGRVRRDGCSGVYDIEIMPDRYYGCEDIKEHFTLLNFVHQKCKEIIGIEKFT